MRADTKSLTDIGTQSSDVSALRADHAHRHVTALDAQNVQRMNDDLTLLTLDGLSGSGRLVQRPSSDFHGRIHRRHLPLRAAKLRDGELNDILPHSARIDADLHRSRGILRIGRLPQT